ncbi:hypothetical protein GCG54_00006512 [Colletotrichum gloeosporioides]|uniref:Uncharacterized protein n=1 Tax=Colletotrichum gloeosporioides TaxID=474922 RepID=A0A8H4CR70_COLGL|nr:uncharacterized protein GCG54_00006512 [Colletotrichum gloeosporioides]KAF3808645.1 hypothetical protein GCG54_00006512 [Colletotrichum gloeosporioides]
MDSKSPHTSGTAADESPMLDSSTNTTNGHDNTDLSNHLMTGTPPSSELIATFESDASEIVRMARQAQLTQVQQEQVRDLFTLASNIVNGQGYSKVSEDQLRLKEKAEELRDELDATKKTLAATGRELGIVKMQIEDMVTMRRASFRQTMST